MSRRRHEAGAAADCAPDPGDLFSRNWMDRALSVPAEQPAQTGRPIQYPEVPGARGSSSAMAEACSQAAAKAIRGESLLLRAQVLQVLATGARTADEVAQVMGRDVLAVRPRFSELLKQGRIADTGTHRPNASGKPATVWALVPDGAILHGQEPAEEAKDGSRGGDESGLRTTQANGVVEPKPFVPSAQSPSCDGETVQQFRQGGTQA